MWKVVRSKISTFGSEVKVVPAVVLGLQFSHVLLYVS